ncbi:MAG: glycosyltransferase [Endomicrobiaceae bacterium]|nr:glycosyltransferase [Endomicrobiaceae bacterium]
MKIVYITDHKFVKYMQMSAQSLLKFNPKAEILVVSDEKLNIKYKNVVLTPPENFLSSLRFNPNDRLSALTYYKLLLPQLPDDKIIYLDCDVLVQKPLDEIWKMPCEYINITEHYLPQKYPNNEKHAICGFMMMNLKNLREDNFYEKCMQNMDYKQDWWWDEEGLINLNYQHRLKYIHKKYCYCKGRKYENPIRDSEAFILHYPSTTKQYMENDLKRLMLQI